MRVSIHTLSETLFSGRAEKLICRTAVGEITILEGHAPLIASITGPEIRIGTGRGGVTPVPLSGGFVEVRPGSEVTILADRS